MISNNLGYKMNLVSKNIGKAIFRAVGIVGVTIAFFLCAAIVFFLYLSY